jgi:beta-mannosidase
VGISRTASAACALGDLQSDIAEQVIKNRPDDRLRQVSIGILPPCDSHQWPAQYYERGAYLSASATIDIWATNSTLEPRRVALELRFIDLHSGEDTQPQTVLSFELAPNATTELVSGMAFPQPAGTTGAVAVGSTTVVSARLLVPDTLVVLARAADFPQPFRALAFPDPVLDLNVAPLAGDDGVSRVRVSVRRPVKTLVLGVADDAKNVDGAAWSWDGDWEARCVKWSDNALDVVPGDEQVVRVQGLRGRPVTVAYMGSERARAM